MMEKVMESEADPRTAAVRALAGDQVPAALLAWLLQSFDALEQTDFGTLEPVGVGAPVPPR
jgi:hypothetical protein